MRQWEIDRIRDIGVGALRSAYQTHEQLGDSGKIKVKKNQYGETALRGDVECEGAVIESVRASGLPLRIISEEHGTVDLTSNPEFIGILDGIDGTKEYVEKGSLGRYGTMFGIFEGLNPKYEDYIFNSSMEHPKKRLFFSSRGGGAFVSGVDGNERPINTSNMKKLDRKALIYCDFDSGFSETDLYEKTFLSKMRDFNLAEHYASQTHYVGVASGEAALALEFTRKGNLEIAVGFGLVKEAGGGIVDIEGRDLGGMRYLEFGQGEKEHIPIIIACTNELVGELVKYLRNN